MSLEVTVDSSGNDKDSFRTVSSFRTAFTDLNLYWIKGALALFILVSGYVCCLYTQLSTPR